MTKTRKPISSAALAASLGAGALTAEIRKSRIGAAIYLSGVISLDELLDTRITAVTHSGRVFIEGERMSVSALEGRGLSVEGRITGVNFGYGKA